MNAIRRLGQRHPGLVVNVSNLITALVIGLLGTYIWVQGPAVMRDMSRAHAALLMARDGGGAMLLLGTIAIVLTVVAYHSTRRFELDEKQRLTQHLLHSIGCALVVVTNGASIRVACRKYDRKTKRLKPYATWSSHEYPDSYEAVSCEGPDADKFVIVRAFKAKWVLCENIADNRTYPPGVHVWGELKSVLAASIRRLESSDQNVDVIGTLSCDSNKTLEESKFDHPVAKDMICACAATVYEILVGGSP